MEKVWLDPTEPEYEKKGVSHSFALNTAEKNSNHHLCNNFSTCECYKIV